VNQPSVRFQYGGHATFPVRYGWLPKGLSQMVREGAFAPSTDVADSLGLGSKMVESLAFWLSAMGLSDTPGDDARRAGRTATGMAKLISANDPYCELPGTWWFLHLALARREGTVWSWFFNDYSERIFDRIGCTDAFLQHTKAKALRPASQAMATKDVSCLLGAYASRPGVDIVDPDDVGACPLRELGLVIRHEAVARFERSRAPVGVPPEAFLACVSLLSDETEKDALSLRELATLRRGPGRILCAGLDFVEEMTGRVGGKAFRGVTVDTSAGERRLEVPSREVTDWLEDFYRRVGGAAS
jgi:hypothetical protein